MILEARKAVNRKLAKKRKKRKKKKKRERKASRKSQYPFKPKGKGDKKDPRL